MRVRKKRFVRMVRIHVDDAPALGSKRLEHIDFLNMKLASRSQEPVPPCSCPSGYDQHRHKVPPAAQIAEPQTLCSLLTGR